MNNLARILLILGAVVLAFLIGLLVGRSQHATSPLEGNAQAVQITTTPPPMAPVTPQPATPLPASIPPPQPVPAPKPAPDAQVQEDAAAVGMTTRSAPSADQPAQSDASPPAAPAASSAGSSEPPN